MFTWNDVKHHLRHGEALFEGNEEHLAVLAARHLDAERRKANAEAEGQPAVEVDTEIVLKDDPAPAPASTPAPFQHE
jgi:hypothetical protein